MIVILFVNTYRIKRKRAKLEDARFNRSFVELSPFHDAPRQKLDRVVVS